MYTKSQQTPTRQPVITRRLGRLLGIVFLLFSLLAVNSVYLAAVTLLEAWSGEVYQDYFYLLMFLLHLVLGLLLVIPVLVFALSHMRRAWHRPNRDAVRAGIALFTTVLVLLVSGLLLTRFDFFEINDPEIRRTGYWFHVISPFVVAWLFVLHRLAGPPIHWRLGMQWSAAAATVAAVTVILQVALQQGDESPESLAFTPSLAVLEGGDLLPPEHLMTDAFCAECHPDIADTHENSVHRISSFNNPAYSFSVRETREVVLKRDGHVRGSRFCAACHDPVPLFSGRFDDPDFDTLNDVTANAGITCMACHAMTAINSTHGNGAYTLADPQRYPFAHSASDILQGINRQLIKAKPAFHSKTLLKPFHKSAEFCSACHKAHVPAEVNHYRWLRAQNHYDSFLQSGVSGHRVDSFYYPPRAVERCSQCHMPLQESSDPAARDFDDSGRLQVHSHLFPGANTGIAHMLELPEQVIEAHREQLSGVTRIDIFGIKEDGRIDGSLHAPLRPALPELEPGRRYLLEIVLRTTGVGHHLTQGTADSNQLWLAVSARENGRIIGSSGDMDETGRVDPWSYFVNAYLLDREGNRIDRRNGQDTFVALYNHQVPPGAASVVHYLLEVPEDAVGPVEIEAWLNYRKFDTTYLQHIQGDAFTVNDLPVTIMASDRVLLPVKGQATAPEALPAPAVEAERWNDYGIGLMREGNAGSGKGELRQAEQAFREVEALDNPNGAVNLARVYFREGRLEDATDALLRATAGQQTAPAWTIAWFSALIDRENGHHDSAIDTLEKIVDTRFAEARERGFDFSKDTRVLNLLGRSLFERSRQARGESGRAERQQLLERSRSWYEKTLQVDPENLAAHFNLALVHARLGNTELANRHRAEHERLRPDDNAIEQAVTTHRRSNPAADHAAAAIVIHDLGRNRPPGEDIASHQSP